MITSNIILMILAFIGIFIATIFDIKTKEIPNWLNFTLLTTALAFLLFQTIITWDLTPLIRGLVGLAIMLIVSNIFYYTKLFGGGDAKLLIALGPTLPLQGVGNILHNTIIPLATFIIVLLVIGFLWGIGASAYLIISNWKSRGKEIKRELRKQNKKYRILNIISITTALILTSLAIGYSLYTLIILAALIALIFPLTIYSKTIENTIMIRVKKISELREGDWISKNIKVGEDVIKSTFEGLTKNEIKHLRKHYKPNKELRIKEGIVFTPAFLITITLYVTLWHTTLNFNPPWFFT